MRFRAPTPDDAPAVLGVLIARDLADLGVPDYTFEDLLDEWRGTDVDLATDTVVVQDGDEIVAYALVRRPGIFAAVHPAHEDRGIGAQLLEWTERRTRAVGRDQYRQWVSAGNARAGVLLRGAGYERARSYWRMVRALDGVQAPVVAPEGVQIRPLEVERDAEAVHALDDVSFAANPDYSPHSLPEFVDEHLPAHDLRPELSGVAELGDRMIGVALCRHWVQEQVGFVDVLAVHPDHQRRGLGSALLRNSFAGFAAAGLREAQLGVASDNPRALALYERVGMHARFQTDVYERPVA
jgi:mycothiol synthase